MSGDGFVSRWSRRKREEAGKGGGATRPDTVAPDAPPLPVPATEAEPPAPTEPVLPDEELAALPPVSSIDASTDVSGFLREGVPAALRNAALRRVWATSPHVRDYLDPARDYAWDWNVPGGVPGDGPLGAGFDARALADRLLGRSRAAAGETASVPQPPEVCGDMSHSGDGNATTREEPAAGAAETAPAPSAPTDAAGVESAAEHGFPVEPGPAAADAGTGRTTENPRSVSDLRPRPRRHGGAAPV